MTEKKSDNKSFKELEQEINNIELSLQRQKEKERKARTHRLIQKGALAEKYFEISDLSPDETETFFKKVLNKLNKGQGE